MLHTSKIRASSLRNLRRAKKVEIVQNSANPLQEYCVEREGRLIGRISFVTGHAEAWCKDYRDRIVTVLVEPVRVDPIPVVTAPEHKLQKWARFDAETLALETACYCFYGD